MLTSVKAKPVCLDPLWMNTSAAVILEATVLFIAILLSCFVSCGSLYTYACSAVPVGQEDNRTIYALKQQISHAESLDCTWLQMKLF